MQVSAQEANNQFRNSDTIASQLPVFFPNGSSLTVVTIGCYQCQHDIPAGFATGTITVFPANVATIRGWGLCESCNLLTPFMARCRETDQGLRMEWLNDGEWVWSPLKKAGFTERLKQKFREKGIGV